MGWAARYIEALERGETVSFRPRGSSMKGKVESGQLVTVEPLRNDPERGDIVLCRVKGAEYLHLVLAVDQARFQIGNARGGINGWVGRQAIFGKCIKIEP